LVDLLDLPQKEYNFKIENELIGNNETPLSVGVKRGDVLIMVPEGQAASKFMSRR